MNTDLGNVIRGLEICKEDLLSRDTCRITGCLYADIPDGMMEYKSCRIKLMDDALSLLKAQELPPVKPEKLEEVTTKWLDEMTAKERLKEIAAILNNWDGYRTAKGLAGLINEVWAYALYPVKVQEPRLITKDDFEKADAWGTIPAWIEYNPAIEGAEPGWAIIDSDILGSPFKKAWTARPTDEQREETTWND